MVMFLPVKFTHRDKKKVICCFERWFVVSDLSQKEIRNCWYQYPALILVELGKGKAFRVRPTTWNKRQISVVSSFYQI